MDPRDRLRARLTGLSCTACGAPSGPIGVRLLATREELTFVLLSCDRCGSEALSMVTGLDDPELVLRSDLARRGEFSPRDEARFETARSLDEADVAAVHEFLAGYHGGIGPLVGAVRMSVQPPRRDA